MRFFGASRRHESPLTSFLICSNWGGFAEGHPVVFVWVGACRRQPGRAGAGGRRSACRNPRQVLPDLPQRAAQDRRPGSRFGRHRPRGRARRKPGRRSRASCARARCRRRARPGRTTPPTAALRRLARNDARCRGGRGAESGPRARAPAEPHRVHQRDSRSARARGRRPVAAVADEPDQQGFDNVASVLSVSPALLESYLSAAPRSAGWRSAIRRSTRSSTPSRFPRRWCRTIARATPAVRIARRHRRSAITFRSTANTRSRSC